MMSTKKLPKQTFFFFLQYLISTTLFAQTLPIKQWDMRFGGSDNDIFSSLQQTADGGYILGGYSLSGIDGDKTQANRGFQDYWLVKIKADGSKQWDKRFGGTSYDFLTSLDQTTDGGYILGGSSYSGVGGDKTEPNRGAIDYWIVKINANGIKQWDKSFGGSSNDSLSSIQQTRDGGYILGGYSSSGISGDKTESSRGAMDYWIIKVDDNGVKQWDRRFGGTSNDYLKALKKTNDGGYILGGYSDSGISGDKTQNKRGGYDYWIVKVNGEGTKLWDKRYGGNSDDKMYALEQTTDGGYILGGESESGISGDKTQASRGITDYWIVKVNAKGIMQMDKRFGGGNYDYFRSLQQTTDGGYILGGRSWSSIGGDKTEESWGYTDYWIVKINGNGLKQWDKRYGGISAEYFSSIQQTADGGYVLGGHSTSGINGDKTQSNRGITFYTGDYWIVKLLSGALKAASTSLNTLMLYPNPSPGNIILTYNSSKAGSVQLTVYDNTGKPMFKQIKRAIIGNNTFQLNLSHLLPGAYNLEVNNGGKLNQVKLLIQK